MRLSLFAGIPAALIAWTIVFELAQRHITYGIAALAGLSAASAAVYLLHLADVRRFHRLLNPPETTYRVEGHAGMSYVIQALRQVRFEDRHGKQVGWHLDTSSDNRIIGKITVRSRVINLNMVAWMLDQVDKGYRPRGITMTLCFLPAVHGTTVQMQYSMQNVVDWSRCEEVISQTNSVIDQAMIWASRHPEDYPFSV